MTSNRKCMLAVALACTVGVVLAPDAAKAWNIVCGISVFGGQVDDTRKWDADSRALRGISHLFWGVSQLQRLRLQEDGTVEVPQPFSGGKPVIQDAIEAFEMASQEFERALAEAQELNLGDQRGRDLLQSLVNVRQFADQLKEKQLPELEALQETIQTAMAYVTLGIELGKQHLGQGLQGHGEGGERYRLP